MEVDDHSLGLVGVFPGVSQLWFKFWSHNRNARACIGYLTLSFLRSSLADNCCNNKSFLSYPYVIFFVFVLSWYNLSSFIITDKLHTYYASPSDMDVALACSEV